MKTILALTVTLFFFVGLTPVLTAQTTDEPPAGPVQADPAKPPVKKPRSDVPVKPLLN